MIDLKFIDLFGQWHHLTIPSAFFTEETFSSGVPFDGSSVGFKTVEAGDMVLIPDPETARYDPFWEVRTMSLLCHAAEADTKIISPRDPRGIARRAEEFLQSTGIADQSLCSGRIEFYIFDKNHRPVGD